MKIKKKQLKYYVIGGSLLALLFLWYISVGFGPKELTTEQVLQYNLREHKNLALHIHPVVEISILGERQPIPANMGITQQGMRVIHTHDRSGTLHVEAPVPWQFYLEDFFTIWGKRFTNDCIFEHCTDENHELIVTVNGQQTDLYGLVPFHDKDYIKIIYQQKQ